MVGKESFVGRHWAGGGWCVAGGWVGIEFCPFLSFNTSIITATAAATKITSTTKLQIRKKTVKMRFTDFPDFEDEGL